MDHIEALEDWVCEAIARYGAFFRGLGDPVRLRLMVLLAHQGEMTAEALAAAVGRERSTVARHLSLLERVGLVRGRRVGRRKRYALDLERCQRTWEEFLQFLREG